MLSTAAQAEGYVLGLGVEGDSSDGRLVSAFADIGAGESTWITLNGALAETQGIIQDNDTVLAGISIDHSFGAFGIRAGAGYWGNADILEEGKAIFTGAQNIDVNCASCHGKNGKPVKAGAR